MLALSTCNLFRSLDLCINGSDSNDPEVRKTRKQQLKDEALSLTANILGRETGAIEQAYTIGAETGKDQFGPVHEGVEKLSGKPITVKRVAKRKLLTREDVEDVRKEVAVSHHLQGEFHYTNIRLGKYRCGRKQFVHKRSVLLFTRTLQARYYDDVILHHDYNYHEGMYTRK